MQREKEDVMKLEGTSIGGIPTSKALRRIEAGEHIVIICKSEYEATVAAQSFFEYAAKNHDISLTDCTCRTERGGRGSVEFGWVATRSGRRLDDFVDASCALEDCFAKKRFPASAIRPLY